MRTRARKVIAAISLLAASGILTSGPGTSCSSYVAETVFTAADTSFIFDCQNGVLGGTFDLTGFLLDCSPTGP